MRRAFGGWDDKEQREMKQQFLRLLITHSEPSIKCVHLERFMSISQRKVTDLTASGMEFEMRALRSA